MSYRELLNDLIAERRDLARCLTRCRICGIEFLTDPRNVKRDDIRCVFGCRQADRTRRSTARSIAYYRTTEGQLKKHLRNRVRRAPLMPEMTTSIEVSQKPLSSVVIRYLCMVAALIRRCPVKVIEILALLSQHSIAFSGEVVDDRPP